MSDPIRGVVQSSVKARAGLNWEGRVVVELRFTYNENEDSTTHSAIVLDIGTAASLIAQLSTVLDDEFNERVNEYLGGLE